MAASEGVDLEWAIVEFARKRKPTRNYSPKIKTQAEKCVAHIEKSLGKSFQIYHSDEPIPGVSAKGIFAKPEPKTDVVIIAKSASIILVASNLPPRPTSRMITSGELFLKYHNAAKVENSK